MKTVLFMYITLFSGEINMKIFCMIVYVLILLGLVIAINKLNDVFGNILACSERVKAKHRGFVRKKSYKGPNPYRMKVSYEFNDEEITTLLLDDYPLSFFGSHASSGTQEVYIDPKKPGRAVLFRKRQVIKYSILYAILVILTVLDIILISTSIF